MSPRRPRETFRVVNAPEGDSNVVNVVQRSRERFYAVNVVQKATTIQRVVVRTGLNASRIGFMGFGLLTALQSK